MISLPRELRRNCFSLDPLTFFAYHSGFSFPFNSYWHMYVSFNVSPVFNYLLQCSLNEELM